MHTDCARTISGGQPFFIGAASGPAGLALSVAAALAESGGPERGGGLATAGGSTFSVADVADSDGAELAAARSGSERSATLQAVSHESSKRRDALIRNPSSEGRRV